MDAESIPRRSALPLYFKLAQMGIAPPADRSQDHRTDLAVVRNRERRQAGFTIMEAVTRIVTLSYTLPSGPEALKEYEGNAKNWSDVVLSEPNVTELRVYRSQDGTQALTITKVQSLVEMDKFLASDKFKTLRSELENAGCSNFKLHPWEASPILPEPLRREM